MKSSGKLIHWLVLVTVILHHHGYQVSWFRQPLRSLRRPVCTFMLSCSQRAHKEINQRC